MITKSELPQTSEFLAKANILEKEIDKKICLEWDGYQCQFIVEDNIKLLTYLKEKYEKNGWIFNILAVTDYDDRNESYYTGQYKIRLS